MKNHLAGFQVVRTGEGVLLILRVPKVDLSAGFSKVHNGITLDLVGRIR